MQKNENAVITAEISKPVLVDFSKMSAAELKAHIDTLTAQKKERVEAEKAAKKVQQESEIAAKAILKKMEGAVWLDAKSKVTLCFRCENETLGLGENGKAKSKWINLKEEDLTSTQKAAIAEFLKGFKIG